MTLVPDWTVDNNGYENKGYLKDKQSYLDMAKEIFGDDMVQDFYKDGGLTDDEKGNLHQLQALNYVKANHSGIGRIKPTNTAWQCIC